MNDARLAYRQSRLTSMTRIDMLIALYQRTLDCLALGIVANNAPDEPAFQQELFRANRLLLALIDGIDESQGEVAVNSRRLLHFCLELVWSRDASRWETATGLLRPILESYSVIRDEAVALELSGRIPPLNTQTHYHQATA